MSATALLVLILQQPDGTLFRFPQGFVSWSECLNRVRDVAIERLLADVTQSQYTINNANVIAAACERGED